ncbi:DUF5069 domain-containing protein [Verrucomicrobiota bacterium sgz303538]
MPSENLETVKSLARDLRTEEPRAKGELLAGFKGGKRVLDKCRATLAGLNGEFIFNCPADQRFFQASGINAEEFQQKVATGASDEEMERWVSENAKAQEE